MLQFFFALLSVIVPVAAQLPVHSVTLTWLPVDGAVGYYQVYRASLNIDGTCGTFSKITNRPVGSENYTDTIVSPGMSYCYEVKLTQEIPTVPVTWSDSAFSDPLVVTIPSP